MKPLATLALALALTGCQLFGYQHLTPGQSLYLLRGDFNAVYSGYLTYARQPPCTPGLVVGCADLAVLQTVQPIAHKVDRALDLAEAAQAQGGDIAVYLAAGRGALAELVATLAKENAQ